MCVRYLASDHLRCGGGRALAMTGGVGEPPRAAYSWALYKTKGKEARDGDEAVVDRNEEGKREAAALAELQAALVEFGGGPSAGAGEEAAGVVVGASGH